MKSLMLLRTVLTECGDLCSVSTTRDYEYIASRVKSEGDSFLEITLPTFATSLERALSNGKVASTDFPGFRRVRGFPAFLQGFLRLIFDPNTGRLIDSPSIDAIFSIRQVSCLFKKIQTDCTPYRNRKAIEGWINCERDIRSNDSRYLSGSGDQMVTSFRRMSSLLFRGSLSVLDKLVLDGNLRPRHGPGKTADRLFGNEKYDQQVWTSRLDEYFPFGEYVVPGFHHLSSGFSRFFWDDSYYGGDADVRDPGAETPVRVVTVPKTPKAPRIIALEPTCMQYTQQAILEPLVELLESDSLISGMIGFTDQTPNQRLAQLGSLTGAFATLDLKEASDRISNQHVLDLFSDWPHASGALQACRSRKADVDGFGVIRLAKFASMGSALCFPVEAMIFLTIIMLGIEKSANRQFTMKDIKRLRGKVRVYGDDIIVPTDMAHPVIEELDAFGYLVNQDKSFWTGKFRESCGKEYYNGEDVTFVKVRRVFPTSRRDVLETISQVNLRNRFYLHGLWSSARLLDSWNEELLKGVYPTIQESSSALGRYSIVHAFLERGTWYPIEEDTHNPVVRAYVIFPLTDDYHLEGVGALLKWFLKRGDQPVFDRNHLERHGRPGSVSIKIRRVPPM